MLTASLLLTAAVAASQPAAGPATQFQFVNATDQHVSFTVERAGGATTFIVRPQASTGTSPLVPGLGGRVVFARKATPGNQLAVPVKVFDTSHFDPAAFHTQTVFVALVDDGAGGFHFVYAVAGANGSGMASAKATGAFKAGGNASADALQKIEAAAKNIDAAASGK